MLSNPIMNSRGITLVEAMIAVAVLALILGIAWPPFHSARSRWTVRSAGDAFALRHSMARSAATRYGRVAELHIDAGAARFWVEVASATVSGAKDTVGPVLDVSDEFGVTTTSTHSVLCFDARGLATARVGCDVGSAALTFSQSGRADTVTITALGKLLR